jgi:hypothetical protein
MSAASLALSPLTLWITLRHWCLSSSANRLIASLPFLILAQVCSKSWRFVVSFERHLFGRLLPET